MSASLEVKGALLELILGDITIETTDAIVNAANKMLSPGGGVSGAIHKAAGPSLWEEARTLGGCQTGEAKMTKGYCLAAKYVIHTVGPVYSGSSDDPVKLANCYLNSLTLADGAGLESISFPSISTGIFGYPVESASMIAIDAIVSYLKKSNKIKLARMVLFSESDLGSYLASLDKLKKS